MPQQVVLVEIDLMVDGQIQTLHLSNLGPIYKKLPRSIVELLATDDSEFVLSDEAESIALAPQ